MWKLKNRNQLLIIILAVGFFIGIIYENILAHRSVVISELILKNNLKQYLQVNVIAEKYFWYVVKARMLLFAFILLLSCFKWKKIFVAVCICMVGFFGGVMTVASVLQLGIKGLFLCAIGLFPQGIFYGMAYSMLFVYWFRYPERRWNHTKTIFVVLMLLVGCMVEVYVNPILVKWMIAMI